MEDVVSGDIAAASPPVGSLSARHVRTLLATLKQHRSLLDSGYEDARRLGESGQRPAYLIDFELLFRFMFPDEERPEWQQELQYLLSHGETTFIIGPGTTTEIDRFLSKRGLALQSDGSLEAMNDRLPGAEETSEISDTQRINAQLAFDLLHVLSLPNVVPYHSVVDSADVDRAAYETVLAVLDKRRRRASKEANQADALNWSAVVRLRRSAGASDLGFYPYLLTATRPLLDERSWGDDSHVPISRGPAEAIYTEVLFDIFPDPSAAADHTVRVAFEASRLERDLRLSPAHRDPAAFSSEPKWERVLEEGGVTDSLRAQLEQLAAFVADPVVSEAQRVYDNAKLAAKSYAQQHGGQTDTGTESPRKLFDLIVGINAALSVASPTSGGLGALWSTVLRVDRSEEDGTVTHTVVDRARGDEYLRVESHPSGFSEASESAELFVLRWPSSLDAERVVASFSQAFERHGLTGCDLFVGLPHQILEFEVDLPVSLDEMLNAITVADDDALSTPGRDRAVAPEEPLSSSLAEATSGKGVTWLRMDAPPFDLYADVIAAQPDDPVVGLFVQDMNVDHVADLYAQTSARYVFSAWLVEALRAIVNTSLPKSAIPVEAAR